MVSRFEEVRTPGASSRAPTKRCGSGPTAFFETTEYDFQANRRQLQEMAFRNKGAVHQPDRREGDPRQVVDEVVSDVAGHESAR